MFHPEKSKHFTRHRDPESGVESWILTDGIAPYQQAFYFVNDSFSGDGRYLWFYCGFPPSQALCLGLLDLESDRIGIFPETQFLDASPAVRPETGEVFFFSGCELWKLAPRFDARPEFVNRLPEEIARGRRPVRIATHITFSPNGRTICIDAGFGRDCFLGEMPLDGGECEIWEHIGFYANHAQFSPVDPDRILFAQDGYNDPVEGGMIPYRQRLWTIRRGGRAQALFPDIDTPKHGHEWWSADGRFIWFVHYGEGTFKTPPDNPEIIRVRPTSWPISHSHCSRDQSLLATDICCNEWDHMSVLFTDLKTGREIFVVRRMPKPAGITGRYHCHPHPRFTLSDRYVVYTTTLRNRADVAVTPVEPLLETLRK